LSNCQKYTAAGFCDVPYIKAQCASTCSGCAPTTNPPSRTSTSTDKLIYVEFQSSSFDASKCAALTVDQKSRIIFALGQAVNQVLQRPVDTHLPGFDAATLRCGSIIITSPLPSPIVEFLTNSFKGNVRFRAIGSEFVFNVFSSQKTETVDLIDLAVTNRECQSKRNQARLFDQSLLRTLAVSITHVLGGNPTDQDAVQLAVESLGRVSCDDHLQVHIPLRYDVASALTSKLKTGTDKLHATAGNELFNFVESAIVGETPYDGAAVVILNRTFATTAPHMLSEANNNLANAAVDDDTAPSGVIIAAIVLTLVFLVLLVAAVILFINCIKKGRIQVGDHGSGKLTVVSNKIVPSMPSKEAIQAPHMDMFPTKDAGTANLAPITLGKRQPTRSPNIMTPQMRTSTRISAKENLSRSSRDIGLHSLSPKRRRQRVTKAAETHPNFTFNQRLEALRDGKWERCTFSSSRMINSDKTMGNGARSPQQCMYTVQYLVDGQSSGLLPVTHIRQAQNVEAVRIGPASRKHSLPAQSMSGHLPSSGYSHAGQQTPGQDTRHPAKLIQATNPVHPPLGPPPTIQLSTPTRSPSTPTRSPSRSKRTKGRRTKRRSSRRIKRRLRRLRNSSGDAMSPARTPTARRLSIRRTSRRSRKVPSAPDLTRPQNADSTPPHPARSQSSGSITPVSAQKTKSIRKHRRRKHRRRHRSSK